MFITFKLTLKRLFLVTAVIIMAVLGVDAVKSAALPQKERCATSAEQVAYLKKQGFEVEAEPLYSNQTVIDEKGASGWSEYATRLKKQGFDISSFFGKRIKVVCYGLKSERGRAVRMLLCDNRVIAYEAIDWF